MPFSYLDRRHFDSPIPPCSPAVKDTPTYNYQKKEESRYGKQLKGSYSWVAPDGYLYTVNYYDDGYGIRMNVQKTRQSIFPGWRGNYGYARSGGYGYARPAAYSYGGGNTYVNDNDDYYKKVNESFDIVSFFF